MSIVLSDKTIYMVQPKRFEVKGKKDLYCLLNKSFYRLKQSSRCWYRRFNNYVEIIRFQRSFNDICVIYVNLAS